MSARRSVCSLAGHTIGEGRPVFIVAEISGNHNGRFDNAARLIREAHRAGADAVKLQTYTPETMTIDSQGDDFRIRGGTLWDGRSLYELYAQAQTPWEWQPRLKAIADELGLALFSSAFDASAVAFLESLGVPAHKVASFELVDLPLIETMAATGKPLILSTGMATSEEIEEAVTTARRAGATNIVLLKCTSAYPALPEDTNLRAIPHMRRAFGLPVGLSDHTLGTVVPVAAVALGACLIEKHLTLSRSEGGIDAAFSLEPDEFAVMVAAVRTGEAALGGVGYGPSPQERESLRLRRSLFVVADVRQGEVLTLANIRSIRPGTGLHPRHLKEALGKRAARDISRGTPLSWNLIS